MRFSLTLPRYMDPGGPSPFRPAFEFARLVDELGYYCGYVGHHSFTPETKDPSAPFVLLSAFAAQTERLRLGSGIFIAGLHHPVAVCEQVTTLDQISGGRAVLGVGTGYRPYEFEGLHVPFGERGKRLDEILAIVRQAWATGRYGYEGKYWSIPDLPIYPEPVQPGGPPIVVGGNSSGAIRRAARHGDGWFTLPMEQISVVAAMVDTYRSQCAAEGRTPYVCLMREGWVAPTVADVEEQWLDRALAFHKYYWEAGTRGDEEDPILQRVAEGERVDQETFARDRAIAGTPEFCVAEIKRWHDAIGFDELCLIFATAQEPVEPSLMSSAVTLFAKEVMPAFD